MKLTEILNSKARFLGANTIVDGKAAIVFNTIQEQSEFNQKLKNYRAMEAKLRQMNDMLPEIEKVIRRFNALRSASGVDTSKEVALLEKFKQWIG
jgi:hypothetical protein